MMSALPRPRCLLPISPSWARLGVSRGLMPLPLQEWEDGRLIPVPLARSCRSAARAREQRPDMSPSREPDSCCASRGGHGPDHLRNRLQLRLPLLRG